MQSKIVKYSALRKVIANEQLWLRESEPIFEEDIGEDYFDTSDRNFTNLLLDFYKFEYAYSMLKNKPFKGNSQRRKNIFNKVKQALSKVCSELEMVLQHVFNSWLGAHALLNPESWAQSRVYELSKADRSLGEVYSSLLYEYVKYLHIYNTPPFQELRALVQRAESDLILDFATNPQINNLFKEAIEWESLKQDYITHILLDFESDPEIIYDMLSIEKEMTYNELSKYLDDTIVIEDYLEELIPDSISEQLTRGYYDDVEAFVETFAEIYIFPLWYEYWQQQGINETREGIEEIYAKINNPGDSLELRYGNLNQALNAVHQTGKMLDHVAEYVGEHNLKDTLQSLTDGEFIPEVDKYLKEAGVQL